MAQAAALEQELLCASKYELIGHRVPAPELYHVQVCCLQGSAIRLLERYKEC